MHHYDRAIESQNFAINSNSVTRTAITLFILLSGIFIGLRCTAQISEGRIINYSGLVGKQKTAATIEIIDSSFSGFFYFVKNGEPVFLKGSVRNSTLKSEAGNESIVSLSGLINTDKPKITGTLIQKGNKKKLPFQWIEDQQANSASLKVVSKKYDYVWKTNAHGDSLGCRAYYSVCFIDSLTNNMEALNKINEELLETDFSDHSENDELIDAALELMDDNFDSYQDDFDSTFTPAIIEKNKSYFDQSPSLYQWKSYGSHSILLNENYLLCIQECDSQYRGGLHGDIIYINMVYDLKSGERVQLASLFKAGYQNQLNQLAEVELMHSYNAGSFEQLTSKGFLLNNHLLLNDNFFIQKNGIGFIFNPNEIATYSTGAVKVFIPWSLLQQNINPDGLIAWALVKK